MQFLQFIIEINVPDAIRYSRTLLEIFPRAEEWMPEDRSFPLCGCRIKLRKRISSHGTAYDQSLSSKLDLRETEAIVKQMPVVSSLKTLSTFLTSLKRKRKKIEIITRKIQTVFPCRIIEQDIEDKLVKFNSDREISRLSKLLRYYARKIISRYNFLRFELDKKNLYRTQETLFS